jgi:hypothetical protein
MLIAIITLFLTQIQMYTPLQAVFAVIGSLACWYFGDYVAKQLGYYPDRAAW